MHKEIFVFVCWSFLSRGHKFERPICAPHVPCDSREMFAVVTLYFHACRKVTHGFCFFGKCGKIVIVCDCYIGDATFMPTNPRVQLNCKSKCFISLFEMLLLFAIIVYSQMRTAFYLFI